MRFRLHQEHHVPIHAGPTFKSMISAHGSNKDSSLLEPGIGHVRSHSEFGCEFLAKGRNPLTVDFKLRRSLDLVLVRGSGCSQQAFAFWIAGCPQKSSVQQCQSVPKFAIHVGPKT